MLKFERLAYDPAWWVRTLQNFSDRTLHQSPAWLSFLAETQRGEVIVAALHNGNSVAGYFTGLKVSKFGLPLLGSPLPGWTTSYMGFNLEHGVPRDKAIIALREFAFRELGCLHLELMDRQLGSAVEHGQISFRAYKGFEIDLSVSQESLFARLHPPCRTCIRKAIRSGVKIVEGNDPTFAADYYAQLEDVFAKQHLRPTYGIERVRALIRHLEPTGQLLLLRAKDCEGHTIASGIFPAMHDRAYFWGAASWRRFQSLRPNELLMWHAMLHWKARGIHFFDMGGGGEYKRKYGGRQISVPWLHISRNPMLSMLRPVAAALVKTGQRLGFSWHPNAPATLQ